MAYCTQSDLNRIYTDEELRQLTDDLNTGSIDSARVSAAITQADNLINSYCRAQHTVAEWIDPDIPELIVDLSVRIAGYYLWKRKRKGQIDEEKQDQYKSDIATLKGINKGDIKLNDPTSYANTAGNFYTNKTSSDKKYTSTVLNKY